MFLLQIYYPCHNSQHLLRRKTILKYSLSRITSRVKVSAKLCLDQKLNFGFQNNSSFDMRLKLLVKYKLTLKRTETKMK